MNNMNALIKEFALECINDSNVTLPFYELKWDNKTLHIHQHYTKPYAYICITENLFYTSEIINLKDEDNMRSLPHFKFDDLSQFKQRIKSFLSFNNNCNIEAYCYPFNFDNKKFKLCKDINIYSKQTQNKLSTADQKKLDGLIETIYKYMISDIKMMND